MVEQPVERVARIGHIDIDAHAPTFDRGQIAAGIEEGEIIGADAPGFEDGAVERHLPESVKPIERGEEREGGPRHREAPNPIGLGHVRLLRRTGLRSAEGGPAPIASLPQDCRSSPC